MRDTCVCSAGHSQISSSMDIFKRTLSSLVHGPSGVEQFDLSPDNDWYSWLKLVFSMAVKIDSQCKPVDFKCSYRDDSFCYEIKLEPSGT